MSALSGAALVVVASFLVQWPTDTEIGLDGDGDSEGEPEAATIFHSADIVEMRGAVLADRGDFRGGPAGPRAKTEFPGRTKQPASSGPVPEPGDDGEYIDPLVDHPASPPGGVSYVGEFQDPEHDVPTPPPYDGILDIGDYLAPEEGP